MKSTSTLGLLNAEQGDGRESDDEGEDALRAEDGKEPYKYIELREKRATPLCRVLCVSIEAINSSSHLADRLKSHFVVEEYRGCLGCIEVYSDAVCCTKLQHVGIVKGHFVLLYIVRK